MGYRRDVYWSLKVCDQIKLYETALNLGVSKEDLKDVINNTKTIINDGNLYCITHLECCKWDSEWCDSNKLSHVVEKFLKDRLHAFVRIGEDYDDIEVYERCCVDDEEDYFFANVFSIDRKVTVWGNKNMYNNALPQRVRENISESIDSDGSFNWERYEYFSSLDWNYDDEIETEKDPRYDVDYYI